MSTPGSGSAIESMMRVVSTIEEVKTTKLIDEIFPQPKGAHVRCYFRKF